MYAPTLVHATLQGYYPRILGDPPHGEPLIIPAVFVSEFPLTLEFRAEQGQLITNAIIDAYYMTSDTDSIPITILSDTTIEIPKEIVAGGLLYLALEDGYSVYPIRILQPQLHP